jgi:hypothetical protein
MTMWEIIELLGPAQRELGSGLMIFGWESTDGRLFLIGGSSLCERPLYARFDQGVPSNKSLERTREDKVPSPYIGARAAQLNR